ncbi:MAG TPA: methyltransferase domain-containing protein [Blastocatellia bacterium]|nr:methyltransferase domain-containing protein [Blastocatellia bacterium]
MWRLAPCACAVLTIVLAAAAAQERKPDVHFVPTPEEVVEKMLELAKVGKDDVVYDLGCGDGRIVIAAAKKYGARGVGVDIDPQRIKESEENARQAGVTDRVKFIQQDLFEMDFSKATVIALYLLPSLNLRLRPKLLRDLKPGSRIVSFAFDMGDWKPEKVVTIPADFEKDLTIYYWVVPPSGDRKN